ncbi:MAG: peptidoglycan DD-metalloendopeptidase family protein [Xanthomonadaceae bacterium]|jgi:septal ring factor EnvC (AmiA/AmiB activator)|nr:peptidoglycan DD-metalloendopeptidase family protein [Xanthomonadaceae bacterium]
MKLSTFQRLSLALSMLLAASAQAQDQHDAERRLDRIRGELRSIAQERRKLEGDRGNAARQLRDAEEKINRSSRALSETEAAQRREQAALDELQRQRDRMRRGLEENREQLANMLRASYALGSHAPLKLLLGQDRSADVNRVLAYHRYAQRERTRRMTAITAGLETLRATETRIGERQAALEATRQAQQRQLAQLRSDREARNAAVADLDKQYRDRGTRERALGQDAQALERLLASLRAAAARRAAEEKAAAERAAALATAGTPAPPPAPETTAPAPRPPVQVATAPLPRVGGMSWPASGDLLARFGGQLPDGHASSGILIGAPLGSTVNAVADGTVVFSEWMTGYGLILIIDHGNGYMSLYAHNDTLLRDIGDRVKRGDAVAKVGNSGGHGRPALYFELRQNGRPVDPASWLQRH